MKNRESERLLTTKGEVLKLKWAGCAAKTSSSFAMEESGDGRFTKLSLKDRTFVQAWKKNPPSNPKLTIQLFERKGIGESGALESGKEPGLPKNIPLIRQTEEKERYRHYDVDVSNNSEVDALHLRVEYVIYVIQYFEKGRGLVCTRVYPAD